MGGLFILYACKSDTTAKPRGHVRLEYPNPQYKTFSPLQPYTFEYNQFATVKQSKKRTNGCDIHYKKMKATLYLTYLPIKNNLKSLLKDTGKLLDEHMIKASAIHDYTYQNAHENIYGIITRFEGKTASNIQFHFTDSLYYFLQGALYFHSIPKPDSLRPAVDYIAKDIKHLAETLRWREVK